VDLSYYAGFATVSSTSSYYRDEGVDGHRCQTYGNIAIVASFPGLR